MPMETCRFDQYQVLYEGLAQKMESAHADVQLPQIYILTTNDVTFALAKISETKICGYTLLRTE
ncbi:hypothetical protein KM043_000023, partial [Ampulex compressa]